MIGPALAPIPFKKSISFLLIFSAAFVAASKAGIAACNSLLAIAFCSVINSAYASHSLAVLATSLPFFSALADSFLSYSTNLSVLSTAFLSTTSFFFNSSPILAISSVASAIFYRPILKFVDYSFKT